MIPVIVLESLCRRLGLGRRRRATGTMVAHPRGHLPYWCGQSQEVALWCIGDPISRPLFDRMSSGAEVREGRPRPSGGS